MKSAVTGGAGFIGSHVVEALISRGDEVLVVDDLSTGSLRNLESARRTGRVQFVEGSICSQEISDAIKEFKPEVMYHLAAQINVRKSVADTTFDAQQNVLGTLNMLETAKASGVRAFVFSSTGGAIYGEQKYYPADEEHPTVPECPYGISKRSGEMYIEWFCRTYDFHGRALRFSNVYGPRQNPKGEAGVVAIFCERLLKGEGLKVHGDGYQTRDFVFVKDVVDAMLRAERSTAQYDSPAFEIFNVGRGIETSVNDIVTALKEAWKELGRDGFPKVEHGPQLPGEQRRSVISAAKLSRELGWNARFDLREGLRTTLESYSI